MTLQLEAWDNILLRGGTPDWHAMFDGVDAVCDGPAYYFWCGRPSLAERPPARAMVHPLCLTPPTLVALLRCREQMLDEFPEAMVRRADRAHCVPAVWSHAALCLLLYLSHYLKLLSNHYGHPTLCEIFPAATNALKHPHIWFWLDGLHIHHTGNGAELPGVCWYTI